VLISLGEWYVLLYLATTLVFEKGVYSESIMCDVS
jgi:hypothetical protein